MARQLSRRPSEVMNLKIWNQKVVSLETLDVEVIESDQEVPEDIVIRYLLREDLEEVLESISPRERDVLRLRS